MGHIFRIAQLTYILFQEEKAVEKKNKSKIRKAQGPKKGTIEYLFKDNSGESFKSELVNLGEPMGDEWSEEFRGTFGAISDDSFAKHPASDFEEDTERKPV
jgi:hypothetical protein